MRDRERRTDGDVTVGALEHLVHALGAERGLEDASDGLGGGDVGLLSVEASEARLMFLLLYDNERPPELVERQRHFLLLLLLHRQRFAVDDCD